MDSLYQDASSPSDDLSALAWVHEELRKSLDAAHKALHRCLKDANSEDVSDLDTLDPAILRTARQQIHQGVGALELAGAPAAAALLRASEQVVQKFVNRPQSITAGAVADVERASFALLDYVGRRLAGKDVSAMALFPQYEALVARIGTALPRPTDLWALDWPTLSLEAPLEPPESVDPREADTATVNDFETGLLNLLRRNQPDDALALANLCAALARGAHLRSAHRESATWMLASGFLEGLAGRHVPLSVHAKRVLSSLLSQLRVLMKGLATPSDRLANELLFFCAQALDVPASERSVLARVRRTFGLERHKPVDLQVSPLGRYDPAWVAQAVKRVGGAKDGWSAVAANELLRLGGLNEQFSLVADSLKRLFPQGQVLADALLDAAHTTVQSAKAPGTSLAMEVATSLLYVEACLEDGEFDNPEQQPRVQRLAERIASVSRGEPAQPLEAWMEDLYRRVSDRQTIGSVVQELRNTLGECEKHIDQFFRDPHDRTPLVDVPSQLQAIRGVLAVLGLDVAARAAVKMREAVDHLLVPDADLDEAARQGVFDRLATNLGALGFLIDMMGVQPALAKTIFQMDEATGVLAPVMGREKKLQEDPVELAAQHAEQAELEQATAVVEDVAHKLESGDVALSEVSEQLQKVAETPVVQEQANLAESVAAAQAALESAQASRDESALAAAREQVSQVLSDFAASQSEADTLGDALAEPAASTLPAPAPLSLAPVVAPEATGLEEDDEMRDIFLEEAREVIENALEALADLARQSDDVGALTAVRRAFHTLKGSSRMVGLKEYGEAAWACEQLYNTWLASQQPASADLQGVTAEVLGHFAAWTDAISAKQDRGWSARPVIEVAEALRLHGQRRRLDDVLAGAVSAPMSGGATGADIDEAGQGGDMAPQPHAHAADESLPPLDVVDVPELAEVTEVIDVGDMANMGDMADVAAVSDAVDTAHAADPASFREPFPGSSASAEGLGAAGAGERAQPPAGLVRLSELDDVGHAAPTLDLSKLDLPDLNLPDLDPRAGDATPAADDGFTPTIAFPRAQPPDTPQGAATGEDLSGISLDLNALGGDAVPTSPQPFMAETLPAGELIELDLEAAVPPLDPGHTHVSADGLIVETLHRPSEPPLLSSSSELSDDAGTGAELGQVTLKDPSEFIQLDDQGEPTQAAALDTADAASGVAADSSFIDLPLESSDGEDAAPIGGPGDAATPSSTDEEPAAEEQVKVIGPLRIGIPLFNIYLNEADEQSRRLSQALGEWALELHRPVHDDAIALAHSLAGNSATVGYTELSQLARLLEHALMRSQTLGPGEADAVALFNEAADEIRRLLHQFAAGFLKTPHDELMRRLEWYDHEASRRIEARSLVGELDDPQAMDADVTRIDPFSAEAGQVEQGRQDADDGRDAAGAGDSGRGGQAAWPDEEHGADNGRPHLRLVRADDDDDEGGAPEPTQPAPLGVAEFKSLEALPEDTVLLTGVGAHAIQGAGPVQWDDESDIDAEDSVDADLFPIFEEEAQELLPQLATQTRQWLNMPDHPAAAAACMRTLHTFKGGARLAGAMRLGEMAHRMESSIERMLSAGHIERADVAPLEARVDRLVEVFEALRSRDAQRYEQETGQHLSSAEPVQAPAPGDDASPRQSSTSVEAHGHAAAPRPLPGALATDGARPDGPGSDTQTTADAADAARAVIPLHRQAPEVKLAPIDWTSLPRVGQAPQRRVERDNAQTTSHAAVRVRPQLLDRLVNHAGEVSITRTRLQSQVSQIRGSLTDLTENLDRLRQQLRDIELQAETQVSTRMEAARAASQAFDPLEFDRYTRFQELTRMMAESVNDVATVQRTLQRNLETAEDQLAAQARLTRDLQDDLLRTRMVEFEGLSDRLYRVVRQAAKETGKHVRLDIVGGSTEVDRGVLDRMTGSFEHLLRNCITHGIESPQERTAAGKEATGQITVALRHEGNEVSIEFRDDGAGLNLQRIRARGEAMGLIAPGASATEAELSQLIFTPGFSTAESVTELAGRGIGMDVVRSEVNAMGGRIESATTPGKGTSFTLILPLTTAVTKVVMLRCGPVNVAVPTHLIEMVRRARPEEVENAYRQGSYGFADLVLPFYWLGALLDYSPRGLEGGRSIPVVIIRSAQQRIALHVDEVLGNQEVVVKNLGPQLSRLPGLAGMTLLASGAVSLIYNPVALATVYGDHAQAVTSQALAAAGPEAHDWLHPDRRGGQVAAAGEADEAQAPLVLVVDDSLTVRKVTQRLLVREGYRVTLAKDGLDALEALAKERPAVVLSDIEMPRMDGFDLVRNIRADQKLSGMPVIMITSRIAQKHRDYATELGVNHYLGKPYGEEELLALVARYTASHHHHDLTV